MSKALVLAANLQQAEEFHKQIAAAKFTEIQFIYPSRVTSEVVSCSVLLDDCYEVIKAEDVDVVVSLHPGLDLVHAALIGSFPHLKGPSCESVFLCLHKLYTRQSLLGLFGMPYTSIDLEDMTEDTFGAALEAIGAAGAGAGATGQAYLRDSIGGHGALKRRVKSGKQFWKERERIRADVSRNQTPYREFFRSYVDQAKYPMAFQSTVLLEKYWEVVAKGVNVHLVEACVCGGEFIPWALSDVTYSPTKPRCVNTVSVPTKLDGFLQMQVWGVVREIVQTLTARGFDYHFINATVLTSSDGGGLVVRVADINTCILRENTALYKHVYQGGDNMRGQLELLAGGHHVLRTPRILDQKFACRCSVTAFTEDVTLGDVMNIKEAKAQGHTDLLVPTGDTWRVKKTDFGTQVARFVVFGTSRDECETKITEVLSVILKEAKHTNWAEPGNNT